LDTAARERPTASAACGVGQVEFVDQALQRLRFFQRVEVFALDVLDQRHRDHGAVVDARAPPPALRPGRPAARRASGVRRR
jgi:hypothetical protein